MVTIPSPVTDLPYTPVQNTRRVIPLALNGAGERGRMVGDATLQILNAARNQQIENEVSDALRKTRTELDRLHIQLETSGDDPASFEQTFAQQSQQIIEQNSAGLSSPEHQRLWRAHMPDMIADESTRVAQLAERRTVERATAGLINSVGDAQRVMTDPDATPQARSEAASNIETQVNNAVKRGTVNADDGARMIQNARDARQRFEQDEGLRVQSQHEADRIWHESGGDISQAMDAASELTGRLRDSVEERLQRHRAEDRADRADSIQDSMGRAYSAIEEGKSVDDLSADDRDTITRAGQMDTLRAYTRAKANPNGNEWTAMTHMSTVRKDAILGVAAEDRNAQAFARLDLDAPLSQSDAHALGLQEGQSVRAQLMPDDFNLVRQRQREMRGEVPMSGGGGSLIDNTYKRIMDVAEPTANSAGGFVARGRTAQDRAQRLAEVRSYVRSEAQQFVQQHNRAPNDGEIDALVGRAFMRGHVGGERHFGDIAGRGMWFGGFEGYAVESGPNAAFTPRFEAIPQGDRSAITNALRNRLHRNPYEFEVEQEYGRYLRDTGGR